MYGGTEAKGGRNVMPKLTHTLNSGLKSYFSILFPLDHPSYPHVSAWTVIKVIPKVLFHSTDITMRGTLEIMTKYLIALI